MYFRQRVPQKTILEMKKNNNHLAAIELLVQSMVKNLARVEECHGDSCGLDAPLVQIQVLLANNLENQSQDEVLQAVLNIEESFTQLLHSLPSKRRKKKTFFTQRSYNEINAILYYSSEDIRKLVPPALYEEIKKKAKKPPNQIIDTQKKLEEHEFDDKTLIFLLYYNDLIEESKKYEHLDDEALDKIRGSASRILFNQIGGI